MVISHVVSTSRSFALTLLSCLVFVMLNIPIAAQTYLMNYCPDSRYFNYTTGSQFQNNLNRLLIRSLYNDGGDSNFSNATEGSYPDEVYGIFLCRGDIPAKTCQDCIDAASTKILNDCPNKKEAIVWYDECLIRYSNTSFFSTLRMQPYLCLSNTVNATEPTSFRDILTNMFSNLTDQATNVPDNRMYANAQVNITGLVNLYGMVQCTPDLSPQQCQLCLSTAVEAQLNCSAGKNGGRILTPSCNIRYEIYPFLGDPPQQPPNLGNSTNNGNNGSGKNKTTAVAISTGVTATVVIVLGFFIYNYNRRRKIQGNCQELQLLDFAENLDGEKQVRHKDFPLLRLDLIRTATQQFAMKNKLGEGGFGPVYKGTLVDGKEIAVKRLSGNSGQGLQEFKAEVTLIAKLQHNNLVKLLGCCLEGKELLLVYDYMPNKSLDVFLFDSTMGAQLDWKRRVNIISGISRGILYLHEDSRLRIIHRDLKASNILLDHDMNPKISDFGMARIFGSNQSEANTNRVVGTYGYMAPEYAMEGIFSVKSDVYSFGVLLLEIVSGKRNGGFHLAGHGYSLLTFAWKLCSDGRGLELMDPLLSNTYVEVEVLKCIQIGLLCVQEDPADRPTMSSVILMLGSYMTPLPQPKEPAFSVGRVVPFSKLQTIDLSSFLNEEQVMASSYIKTNDIRSSVTTSDVTLSNSSLR